LLSSLATWVQDVIEQLGYLGVALLVVLENVFPPIPSEIVLPFAGFVAQQGSESVVLMILAATVGSVIGALIMYWIAAIIGDERLHAFTRRFGKWVQIREADLTRAEERRMKLIPYIAYTFLGSLVWNIALVGAGAVLGENWERVEPVVATFQWIVIVVILAGVARVAYVVVQRRRTL